MTVITTFGSMSGNVPATLIDNAFALCASQADFSVLSLSVTNLPANALPLVPVTGGVIGVSGRLARQDHQHPPQSASVNLQTGTTYTVTTSDNGKTVELSNGAAIAVTISNDLPVGFNCVFTQAGVGQVTFAPQSGGIQRQASGYAKARLQWSMVSLYVRANSGGAAAEYVLSGDMAA